MEVGASMSVGRLAPQHSLNINGIRLLAKNVTKELIKDDVILIDELRKPERSISNQDEPKSKGKESQPEYYTISEYTDIVFQPYIDQYNAKQRRKDRKVNVPYTEWHKNNKNLTQGSGALAYEAVLQYGRHTDIGGEYYSPNTSPERKAELKKEFVDVYSQWVKDLQEHYPHMHIVYAAIHFSEEKGTPHMHVCFQPHYESARGIPLQVSVGGALGQDGIKRVETRAQAKKEGGYQLARFYREFHHLYQNQILEDLGYTIQEEKHGIEHIDKDGYSEVIAEAHEKADTIIKGAEEVKEKVQELVDTAHQEVIQAQEQKKAIEQESAEIEQESRERELAADKKVAQANKEVAAAEQKKENIEVAAEQIKNEALEIHIKAQQSAKEAEEKKKKAEQISQKANEEVLKAQEAARQAISDKEQAIEQKAEIEAQAALQKQASERALKEAAAELLVLENQKQNAITETAQIKEQAMSEAEQIKAEAIEARDHAEKRVREANVAVEAATQQLQKAQAEHSRLQEDIEDLNKFKLTPSQLSKVKKDIEEAKKTAKKEGLYWAGDKRIPVRLETLEGMVVKAARVERLDDLEDKVRKLERDVKHRESLIESKAKRLDEREAVLSQPEAEYKAKLQAEVEKQVHLRDSIYKNKAEQYDKVKQERDRFRDEVNEYHSIASRIRLGRGITLQNLIDAAHNSIGHRDHVVSSVVNAANSIIENVFDIASDISELIRDAARHIGEAIHRQR